MKHSICVLIVLLGCSPGWAQLSGVARGGRTEASPYTLRPGQVQLAGRFGASYLAGGVGQSQPTVGGEVIVGLPYNLALFGEGTRHNSVDLGIWNLKLGSDLWDLGLGLEWNIPNRTRVVPYLRGGIGLVHLNVRGRTGWGDFWVTGSKFAGNFGGGLRIHLKPNYGFLFEFRGFDGPDFPWMVRPSLGFFYRFN